MSIAVVSFLFFDWVNNKFKEKYAFIFVKKTLSTYTFRQLFL